MRIRLYLNTNISVGENIVLPKEKHHYLINVIHIKPNESVFIFNNQYEWICEILSINKKQCTIRPLEITQSEKDPINAPKITLFCPIVTNNIMNQIISSATELGVSNIYPCITKYTNIYKINIEKLTRIAISAAEQSNRISIPKIHNPIEIKNIIKSFDGIILLANEKLRTNKLPYNNITLSQYESNNANNLKISTPNKIVASQNLAVADKIANNSLNQTIPKLTYLIQAYKQSLNKSIACLVGPEGGFSLSEFEYFSQFNNLYSVSLGQYILRVETAICGILQYANIISTE